MLTASMLEGVWFHVANIGMNPSEVAVLQSI